MDKLELSIIICTYNRDDFIFKCLEGVNNQTCDKSKYEIILINNNSTDTTEQICLDFKESYPDLNFNYFVEMKQGLSAARNRGIVESKASLISFIDDDAIVCTEYVKEVTTFFNSNENAVALGGKILPLYETERPNWMSKFLEPLMSVINLGDIDKEFPKDKYPIGANMVLRKDIINKVGNFNENLGRTGKNMLGGEEKDIFNKIKLAGGKIWYSSKPWVYHQVPDKRLTTEFIKKQALGIGYSEKVRALDISKFELLKSIASELFKWAASILLFILYGLQLQFSKAIIIVRFRYWVSSGFIAPKI